MWRYVILFAFSTQVISTPSPSMLNELAAGCVETGKFVSDPGTLAKKAFKDAKDFEQFPDKSKLPQKNFTASEVLEFDGKDGRNLYIIVSGKVYDITTFSDFHPAGPEPFQKHAGHDATAAIQASGMPEQVYTIFIKRFCVGDVVETDTS